MATIPDHSDVDHATLFVRERQALLDLLASLDDADWDRPTPCPGWSVLDVSCHLVGNDLSLLARQRDGHFGTRPPDGPREEAAFIEWLDALQDRWVQASRRLSSRLVIDLLAWTDPQLKRMFRDQDTTAWTASVSWADSEPVPVWLDHARELSEYWIHRQQLRQALNRPPELATPTAAAVLDALRWAYPYRLASIAAPGGDTVVIVITGDLERCWSLRTTGSGWAFTDKPGTSVIARLRMTADQAWRLLTNNLSPLDQRGLDITGDEAVVNVLRRTRAIIGTPNTDASTVEGPLACRGR